MPPFLEETPRCSRLNTAPCRASSASTRERARLLAERDELAVRADSGIGDADGCVRRMDDLDRGLDKIHDELKELAHIERARIAAGVASGDLVVERGSYVGDDVVPGAVVRSDPNRHPLQVDGAYLDRVQTWIEGHRLGRHLLERDTVTTGDLGARRVWARTS